MSDHKHMMRRVDVVYGTPRTWYFECECGAWAYWDRPPHSSKALFDAPDELGCLSTVEREKSLVGANARRYSGEDTP